MRALFQTIVFEPIFNAFVGLYNLIPDVGIVILLLTIVIKAILWPLTASSIKAQKSLTELQPKLEELKQKHKDNQQVLAQETMKLYKENKVNPFGSCLPLLLQIPIFLALYWVLQRGLTTANFDGLYPFVPSPGQINTVTLGLVDLKNPSIILAILAGIAQYWQAKMFTRKKPPAVAGAAAKDEAMATIMNRQMLYVMPAMTVLIGAQLPGGLALYWLLSTALTALQQKMLFKKQPATDKDGILEGKVE